MNDKLTEKGIEAALTAPLRLQFHKTVASTNLLAKTAGRRDLLIVAREQTAGRGRSGKSFCSPEGGVYMTLCLEAKPLPEQTAFVTVAAAVAAAQAIESVLGISCGLKWVNDLFFNGKKVCGILAEYLPGKTLVAVGLGINLYERDYGGVSQAGALLKEARHGTADRLAAEIANRICALYYESEPQAVLCEYEGRLAPQAEKEGFLRLKEAMSRGDRGPGETGPGESAPGKTAGRGNTTARSGAAFRVARIGLSCAFLVVMSQLSVPTPSGVPITLQVFAVALCGALFGPRDALLTVVCHLALGAVGLPVFSSFSGGVGRLFSLTGGFLFGFLPLAGLSGLSAKRRGFLRFAPVFAGLVVCNIMGAAQFAAVSGVSLWQAVLTACAPYLLKDALLCAAAPFAAAAAEKAIRMNKIQK